MSVVAKAIYLLLFSRSVMSNSLWLHGLQHARLPCEVNKTPVKISTGMFPELVKKKKKSKILWSCRGTWKDRLTKVILRKTELEALYFLTSDYITNL